MNNKSVLNKFVIPQMVAMLFNSVYLIVDGIFIGHRLGADALAVGGLAVPVVEIVIAIAIEYLNPLLIKTMNLRIVFLTNLIF